MKEVDHIKHVFIKVNQYPDQIIENIIKKELRNKETDKNILAIEVDIINDIHMVSMTLPSVGNKGGTLVKKPEQDHKSKFPVTVKAQIMYTAKKLGSAFQIKDQTKLNHRRNITYLGTCPECKHRCVGQSNADVKIGSLNIIAEIISHTYYNLLIRRMPEYGFKTLKSSVVIIQESIYIKHLCPDLMYQMICTY